MTDAGTDRPRIPGWELERLLGQGGMGVVWAGRRSSDGREAALKVIRPRAGGAVPDAYRRRFLREIAVMGSLTHPGIPAFVDAGVTGDGSPWLAVELLEGTTLEDAPGFGSWTVPMLRPHLLSLLDTLGWLHGRGLVHRDIKPANVFLAPERTVLLDLGLVFVASATRLTATGEMAGTLAAMSPEQLRGDPATPSTDLYQLAATAWMALHGTPPRTGPVLVAMAAGHGAPPPLRAATGDAACDAWLERCLAVDPVARPSTAADAAALLAPPLAPAPTPPPAPARVRAPAALHLPPGPPPRPPARRRSPLPLVLTLTLTCGLLIVALRPEEPPALPPPAPSAPPTSAHVTAEPPALAAARTAWRRFLARTPGFDPILEFLRSAPFSLPPDDADLAEVVTRLDPDLPALTGPPAREAAILLSTALLALRDGRAHEVAPRHLRRLARSGSLDDPATVDAMVLCVDAVTTLPRGWHERPNRNKASRARAQRAMSPDMAALAATDPNPARAALWRVLAASLLDAAEDPATAVTLLDPVAPDLLPPEHRWRWYRARSHAAEALRRFDELPSLYAAGAAAATTDPVRIYFQTRGAAKALEATFGGM